MFRIAKIMFCVLIFCGLVACNLLKTSPPEPEPQAETKVEEKNRKIKTAKINAQLGIAYLETKNVQRAKHKLLLALKQAPDIPETWYSMAYFLEATGNKTEAHKYYIKAVEIAPSRGDAQNNYGTFLCRSGFYQASIMHFLAAVKDQNYLDPAAAYENAGLCAMKIPAYKEAIQYFNQSVQEDPARPVALIKLAEIYYLKGNYKHATEKLNQHLAISPPSKQSLILGVRISKALALQKKTQEQLLSVRKVPSFPVKVVNKQQIVTKKPLLSLRDNPSMKKGSNVPVISLTEEEPPRYNSKNVFVLHERPFANKLANHLVLNNPKKLNQSKKLKAPNHLVNNKKSIKLEQSKSAITALLSSRNLYSKLAKPVVSKRQLPKQESAIKTLSLHAKDNVKKRSAKKRRKLSQLDILNKY